MSVGFDPNLLLGFYSARLASASAQPTAHSATVPAGKGATAKDVTPWSLKQPAQAEMDAKVLSMTNFLDTSKVPLITSGKADAQTEQDNQKLFSLYSGFNNLAYLAKMAQRDDATAGQLAGLNTRFQAGLKQVKDYIASTDFNNFKLQAANPSASVTSSAVVPFGSFDYATKTLVSNAKLTTALPGLSTADSFTIAVKKGGTTTNVTVNLSSVSGALTLDNIITTVNQQLSAGGFKTRFQKIVTQGSLADPAKASYGLQVSPGANETISLSSAAATPSLYLAGNTGTATDTTTTNGTTTTAQAADQQGRLIKLSAIDSTQTSAFSVNAKPSSGTTTAQATAVDSSGNVYVVGNATGNFGNQLIQGAQDAYLTKYDSAGNVLWTRMLGSTGTANGYALALDPTGGVVVAGSTTGNLTTTSIANGNTDTYVTKYDTNGNQSWVKQLPTLNNNQAAAVSVDTSGNVFIGGQVTGVIGAGQSKIGGSDAYVAKLDNKGAIVYEKQLGTTSADTVSAMATASDGSLYVASVQNGHAIVSKYAGGDATVAATWTKDLGDLQNGGGIGGLTVSGTKVYVTGTTQNTSLTASGAATIAHASSGGADAFVFALTDAGASATANFVSYVGTSGAEKGGALAVGSTGTLYLTGSTTGTFAGQTRNIANVSNMFATSLSSAGAINWTRQYGGLDGISSGNGIAIDTSGSSVLDALGLPRGTINPSQSVDLASATTLRTGDSFKIQFSGTAARTATITIDKGETLQSLATKINIQLQTQGKASVNYTGGAAGLKIAVNAGVTLDLVAGPKDFDALARLGIPAGTLTGAATASSATSTTGQAFGLGLTGALSLSTRTGANLARSQLLGVLSSLQSAYQKTNTSAAPPSIGNTSGHVSPYLQSQLSDSTLALNLLA